MKKLNFWQPCFVVFQITFLHLKYHILHIENLTSDEKKIGYQAFNEYSAD